ncbi:hypothetical protein AJ80_00813 [Polytolypa hystricis UAMH7299]|uniref:Phosphatidate phosphatase APP1 catalytic domain-containing protein n=1 Tax=Polytolypa hystricis (strain UAMH7299) TaxID=1447883 RepID=A0A2B7Z2J8_POLH7|nr:hypothetical protein AJ80_00813 [Polytolypa hystricis UAMH7299]
MSDTHQRARGNEEEQETRGNSNFAAVESKLALASFIRFPSILDYLGSFLGKKNPLALPANPAQHKVWLFDNTAYQASDRGQTWESEVVVCIFVKHRREGLGKYVAIIADLVGLDGEMGMDDDRAMRERIAERVQPFVDAVAPAKIVSLNIPLPHEGVLKRRLDPSDRNGIVSQVVSVGEGHVADGTVMKPTLRHWPHHVSMDTEFVGPEGWMIISDLDDTIKYTQTSDPIGILRSTFIDEPVPIAGMPQLYNHAHRQLNPAWFYLSASPYNLFPFLRTFLRSCYPPGTLILRDNSWMDLGGLLKSFTQGTQAYKVNRLEKLHSWLPKRKIILIGDSTQSDPEAYAEMYHKQKKWIRAIFIRRVTDVAHMEDKNKPERFEKAFEGVSSKVWMVFDRPEELYQRIDELKQRYSERY